MRSVCLVLALLVTWSCARSGLCESYVDSQRGWSIDLPPGYKVMDGATLNRFREAARGASGVNFEYITGFMLAKNVKASSPYVLVQFTAGDMSQMSKRDFETAFGNIGSLASQELKKSPNAAVQNARVGASSFDSNTGMFRMNLDLPTGAMDGPTTGACVGHITNNGAVQVNTYFRKGRPPEWLEAFVATMKIEPSVRWTPREGGLSNPVVRKTLIGAAAGGLGGLIIAIVKRVKGRG